VIDDVYIFKPIRKGGKETLRGTFFLDSLGKRAGLESPPPPTKKGGNLTQTEHLFIEGKGEDKQNTKFKKSVSFPVQEGSVSEGPL